MIRILRYIISLFVLLPSLYLQAQQLMLSTEAGLQAYTAKRQENKAIRINPANWGQAYDPYGDYSITAGVQTIGAGFHLERMSANAHWSISVGLRYASIVADVSAANGDYFLYRYTEQGLDTYFVRIESITQRTQCLALPLQLRFFPTHARKLRFYMKLSVENNFRITSSESVRFRQDEMQAIEDTILAGLEQPDAFNAAISLAGGIRFQGKKRLAGGFEVLGPTAFLTGDALGIVSPSVGMGFQVNVLWQLKKTVYE